MPRNFTTIATMDKKEDAVKTVVYTEEQMHRFHTYTRVVNMKVERDGQFKVDVRDTPPTDAEVKTKLTTSRTIIAYMRDIANLYYIFPEGKSINVSVELVHRKHSIGKTQSSMVDLVNIMIVTGNRFIERGTQQQCDICCEEFNDKTEKTFCTTCSNTFCATCLENQVKHEKYECPMCRDTNVAQICGLIITRVRDGIPIGRVLIHFLTMIDYCQELDDVLLNIKRIMAHDYDDYVRRVKEESQRYYKRKISFAGLLDD